jgi:hypothetical protein
MELRASCQNCNRTRRIVCDYLEFHKWRSGATVQESFIKLSDSHKQMLETNLCDECFEKAK